MKASEHRTIVWALVVLAVAALSLAGMSAANYTPLPAGAPYEPNPYVEGNVTVLTHQSSMGTFGYLGDNGVAGVLGSAATGTGYQLDPNVKTPYVVDFTQTASVGYLQGYILGGGTSKYVNLTSSWGRTGTKANGTLTLGSAGGSTVTGASTLIFKSTGYASTSQGKSLWQFNLTTPIPITTAYRFIVGASTDLLPTNTRAYINVTDGSNTVGYTLDPAATLGSQTTTSHVIATAAAKHVFYQDRIDSLGTSTTLTQVSSVSVTLNNAAGGSLVNQVTITGFEISSGAYLQFGTDVNGTAVYVQDQGNTSGMKLASFAPSFFYNAIGNFKAAFYLPASALVGGNVSVGTIKLNIASGWAAEQQYGFDFKLVSALQLSYANLVLRDLMNVGPKNFVTVSLNGVNVTTSYTSSANKVGTLLTLSSSLSANTDYILLESVLYTDAQWTAISVVPGGAFSGASVWIAFLGFLTLFGSVFGLGVWARGRALNAREYGGPRGGGPPPK